MTLESLLVDPLFVGGGTASIILALGKWWQIRHGSEDKRMDNQLASRKQDADAELAQKKQDHTHKMELNQVLLSQLEIKDERIEALRIEMLKMGEKYTGLVVDHARDKQRITDLERRAVSCEKDREALNSRLRLVEQSTFGRALPSDPDQYDPRATNQIDNAAEKIGLPPEDEDEPN